jgi:hypothetical protein
MVKSTYVLDVETAASLDRLARDWQVSKSEALRRVIRSAAAAAAPDRVDVLRRLQQAAGLTQVDANAWAKAVRIERHATAARPALRRRR